jgi:hypothetical protein
MKLMIGLNKEPSSAQPIKLSKRLSQETPHPMSTGKLQIAPLTPTLPFIKRL